ncbi:unnamed protein product [Haemonchus placei]|uniref:SET domain-containing protein n=1 Tax=Haemonchus placei TaxID=6290 RepID=A0A0N4W753_HAEPC|nr:unnamed protein product [Haemonchus placei]
MPHNVGRSRKNDKADEQDLETSSGNYTITKSLYRSCKHDTFSRAATLSYDEAEDQMEVAPDISNNPALYTPLWASFRGPKEERATTAQRTSWSLPIHVSAFLKMRPADHWRDRSFLVTLEGRRWHCQYKVMNSQLGSQEEANAFEVRERLVENMRSVMERRCPDAFLEQYPRQHHRLNFQREVFAEGVRLRYMYPELTRGCECPRQKCVVGECPCLVYKKMVTSDDQTLYDNTYVFDINEQVEGEPQKYAIDGTWSGNISRFFNHTCVNPTLEAKVLFTRGNMVTHDLAFFTTRDIEIGEELVFCYSKEVMQQRTFGIPLLKISILGKQGRVSFGIHFAVYEVAYTEYSMA